MIVLQCIGPTAPVEGDTVLISSEETFRTNNGSAQITITNSGGGGDIVPVQLATVPINLSISSIRVVFDGVIWGIF